MDNLKNLVLFLFIANCFDININSEGVSIKSGPIKNATSRVEGKNGVNSPIGIVNLYDLGDFVRISGQIKGLVPYSIHGFHIHEFGDLENSCMNTGDHYNPFHKNHGGPQYLDRHVGDLGNFQADIYGQININAVDHLVKINGQYSVIGRSFVLHERRDNYTAQPAGDAGARIACGVIGIGK